MFAFIAEKNNEYENKKQKAHRVFKCIYEEMVARKNNNSSTQTSE